MKSIEIYKVTINHFRGYREQKVFDFENEEEIIILAGPNGFGKTSVFDAIEWGFTGKLSRFDEPNEEKNNSCFINFQPFEKNGEVCIEFGNSDYRYYLKRKSTYIDSDSTDYSFRKSTLCVKGNNINDLYNNEAVKFLNKLLIKEEWRDKIDFTEIFSIYHVLTQDKIKKFIQGLKAPDRYKQVSMMVGTQRFYKYKEFLSENIKTCNENIKSLVENKKQKKIQIDNIKEFIHDDTNINIGNYKTIKEWIENLVKRYNESIDKLNVKKYSFDSNNNYLDVITDLKKNIMLAQQEITNIKYKKTFLKEKFIEIRYNLNEYKENKYKLKQYNNILPILECRNKFLYMKSQLPLYKKWNETNEKNDINILNINNELKQIEIYLLKFTNLYNEIKFVLNEIDRDEKYNENDIESMLKSDINLLKNNTIKFDDINKIIIDKKLITFLEYKEDIDIDLNESTNLNDFLKLNIDLYEDNINQILNKYLVVKKNTIDIKRKISDLDNDIRNLSQLENHFRNILIESLEYIKKDIEDKNGEVKCPVCSSIFNKNIFVKNIEEKLSINNKELSIKIKNKSVLEKELETYQNKLSNLKNNYIKSNKKFLYKISEIKNSIILLGQNIRKKEKKYNDEIKVLNEENIKIQEKKSSFMELKKSLGLSKDNLNEIEKEIDSKLKSIDNNLNENQLQFINLKVDDLQGIINNYKQKINSFEEILKEFKINLSNIEEDIEYKYKNVDNDIILLQNNEASLKYLEENFNNAYKELSNLNRMKELRSLEEQYIKLKELEEKNTLFLNVLEKLEKCTMETIQEMSEYILTQHQEFINIIYKRINPHPLFTEIEFSFNKSSKGKDILNINCINKGFKNKVNPAFTFSSAQVNVVAVSVFLGMALRQECSNLKTIMLDDPIQNMDDLNVISFIDILRNCLSINKTENNTKQIIISTHDQDIYRIMEKNLGL